jgi:tryptophan-rich sensory protein
MEVEPDGQIQNQSLSKNCRVFILLAESSLVRAGGANMRWISLICWLGLCFGAASISARWTASELLEWYRTLTRPAITPRNSLFGPVWTLLYALMSIAAWLVWESAPSPLRNWGLVLFLVQLALNVAWSLIFFRFHAIGAAMVEAILLWFAIGATALLFNRVSPAAAWLMAPYWAWTGFAAVLNEEFWRLNRRRVHLSVFSS